MSESTPRPEALLALAGILVAEQSLEATLAQVVELACETIEGGDIAGITLLDKEGPVTAAASNEEARRVDALQYAVGSGPCLDAYRHQTTYRIPFTPDDVHWPEFSSAAAQAGVMSTLSLPLVVHGDGIGALNLYCRHEAGFSSADEVVGRAFASYASVALANARTFWRAQTLADQLEEALTTRAVIDQAKGILIAQQGCTADEAFELLARVSQRTHKKLHDVAAELVEQARARRRQ